MIDAPILDEARLRGIVGNWADGSGPLYSRLARALARAIERGDILPGARLPAERLLAETLAVSRGTVVACYDHLAAEQWLRRRQGSGTYVEPNGSHATAGVRQHALSQSLDRNTMFRGLITGSGETIDFSLAAPQAAPAVVEAIRRLPEYLPDPDALGPGYIPSGLPRLRVAVADYLTNMGLPTADDHLLITGGGQQGLSLLASLWLSPGDAVVVENPCYPGALDAFRAAGARLLSVPVDEEGVRTDLLRELVTRTSPRLVYVTSSFNNPTGVMLSGRRRRELAQLAEDFQLPVVEDLVLAEIAVGPQALPSPAAAAAGDWIWNVGSMSKLFWGGIRVGWVRAPEQMIFRLAQLKAVADLGTSLVTQWLCVDLLRRVDEVRAWRAADTRQRLQVLMDSLSDLLPSWTWDVPAGGNDLWVKLPQGNATDFLQVAVRHGVMAAAGPLFSPDGGHADRLRLPFVLPPAQLREGVRRLAQAWDAYLPRSSQPMHEVKGLV